MSSDGIHLILYDGICTLCDGSVHWIIRHDKNDRFLFVTLQSAVGNSILNQLKLSKRESNSVVYVTNKGIFTRSSAALQILKDLGNGWHIFYVFHIVPRFVRDTAYDFIARIRYRIFGRKKYCEFPEDLDRKRFILLENDLPDLSSLINK
ncbi:MAG: DUF393 domain-containing protein [Bacteroidales bacterium]|nr:DUF393 domain-containing protein [Bacteroidales bacterium]